MWRTSCREKGREEREGEKRWKEWGSGEVGDEPESLRTETPPGIVGGDNKETQVFVTCVLLPPPPPPNTPPFF